jgi:hypothetical protein
MNIHLQDLKFLSTNMLQLEHIRVRNLAFTKHTQDKNPLEIQDWDSQISMHLMMLQITQQRKISESQHSIGKNYQRRQDV